MKPTYEQLMAEVVELRRLRDQADARLLLRLMEIERDHIDVIESAGSTMAHFCEEIISWKRYAPFKRGVEAIGASEALAVGSAATIQAGRIDHEPDRDEYVTEMRQWVEDHHGATPTAQTAADYRRKIAPTKQKTLRQKRNDELARLQAENAQLKAEVRSLKRKLAKLDKEAA